MNKNNIDTPKKLNLFIDLIGKDGKNLFSSINSLSQIYDDTENEFSVEEINEFCKFIYFICKEMNK